MIGHIPKRIAIYSSISNKVSFNWDDLPPSQNQVTVYPAMVADADNPENCDTAKKWATTVASGKKALVKEEILDNVPVGGIQIITLEKRSQGGRAYKVMVSPNNYYFDFREDVLLDSIINEGIASGGILNGKYLWARVHSQLKLIREGSALHKAVFKASEAKKLKPFHTKDLKAGTIYSNKLGEFFLYLGEKHSAFLCKKIGNIYESMLESGPCWIELQENKDLKNQKNWLNHIFGSVSFIKNNKVVKEEGYLTEVSIYELIDSLKNNILNMPLRTTGMDFSTFSEALNLSDYEGYIHSIFKDIKIIK